MIIKLITAKMGGIFCAGDTKPIQFGTFAGVFTPDVLCIFGVIMYLRLGWVVENTGFLGALAISHGQSRCYLHPPLHFINNNKH
jgi:hypothetical protein